MPAWQHGPLSPLEIAFISVNSQFFFYYVQKKYCVSVLVFWKMTYICLPAIHFRQSFVILMALMNVYIPGTAELLNYKTIVDQPKQINVNEYRKLTVRFVSLTEIIMST